jgi:signal transduction histidine kinase
MTKSAITDASEPAAAHVRALGGGHAEDQARRLARALRRQTELNRQMREIMLMAAHEFGTPLAIIDSQARGLERRTDQLAPDDLRRRSA